MNRAPSQQVHGIFCGAIVLSALLLASSASAQEGQQAQQQESPTAGAAAPGQSNPKQRGTSKDRLFYTLPNFLTLENVGKVPPLTTAEKFKAVARGNFDYVQWPWWGFLAGLSQAENSEAGYGQGAAGYGKRYGATVADGTIENFMVGAVFPSILRQDPRYYQSGKGGFLHRLGYAMSRMVITRTDSGGEQFNFSEIFGSATSATVATYSYHPRGDKTVLNTASVWGTQIGYDTLTLVVKEFWPDIRRKLSHKRPAPANPQGSLSN